jgi:GNAT superfamily N-acetyltransferase
VRPLRDDDLQRVAELAKVVYGSDALTNVSYLDWKFNRNPSGKAIVAVCECQDRVIGITALFPQVFKSGSSTWRGACGGDLMVDPQFRRQGIFIALVRSLFDWVAEDIAFVYGVRSLKSSTVGGLFKYFEYVNIGDVNTLTKYLRVLSSIRALSFSLRPTLTSLRWYLGSMRELISVVVICSLSSLIVHSMNGRIPSEGGDVILISEMDRLVFGEEFNRLWEEVKDSLPITVVKNSAYLNWRYANPAGRYVGFRACVNGVLRGYAILVYAVRGKLKTAMIMDILAANSDIAAKLVDKCMRRAKQDQAHIFKMWETKETRIFPEHPVLRRAWHKEPLVMHVLDSQLPRELVDNIANWCVSSADTKDEM